MQRPSLGRQVVYRSNTGNYDLTATITATEDTLWPEGVERGDVPPLTSKDHVHLHVFTPGALVHYQEHDVPLSDDAGVVGAEHAARTWRWPDRV